MRLKITIVLCSLFTFTTSHINCLKQNDFEQEDQQCAALHFDDSTRNSFCSGSYQLVPLFQNLPLTIRTHTESDSQGQDLVSAANLLGGTELEVRYLQYSPHTDSLIEIAKGKESSESFLAPLRGISIFNQEEKKIAILREDGDLKIASFGLYETPLIPSAEQELLEPYYDLVSSCGDSPGKAHFTSIKAYSPGDWNYLFITSPECGLIRLQFEYYPAPAPYVAVDIKLFQYKVYDVDINGNQIFLGAGNKGIVWNNLLMEPGSWNVSNQLSMASVTTISAVGDKVMGLSPPTGLNNFSPSVFTWTISASEQNPDEVILGPAKITTLPENQFHRTPFEEKWDIKIINEEFAAVMHTAKFEDDRGRPISLSKIMILAIPPQEKPRLVWTGTSGTEFISPILSIESPDPTLWLFDTNGVHSLSLETKGDYIYQ